MLIGGKDVDTGDERKTRSSKGMLIGGKDVDTEDERTKRSNKRMTIVGNDGDTEDERKTRCNKVDVRAVPSDTEDDDEDDDREEHGSEYEELVLRIFRDARTGLGISVAGGVGTTAFKEGDEVATAAVLCHHRHCFSK